MQARTLPEAPPDGIAVRVSALFHRTGPFERRNPRLFVFFTTLYNARAYYPVLAVLFTDLGLRLDQFVLLNGVWAAAIFLFEVPSGALGGCRSAGSGCWCFPPR